MHEKLHQNLEREYEENDKFDFEVLSLIFKNS